MKNELRLLNLFCFVAALVFLALAVLNALSSGSLITTDNLFITMVCLLMALLFAINPILYLHSEGRLPIPFQKRIASKQTGKVTDPTAPLLDAKGRAVPPDVRAMVANMRQTPSKD
jgi:hypothetical protein